MRSPGRQIRSWGKQVREHFVAYAFATLFGVSATIVLFYITAVPTDSERIKAVLLSDVKDALNIELKLNSAVQPVIERFASQRLDLNSSDSIVLYGSWEPEKGKIYKWVNVFEPREQDLLSKIVGRPGFHESKTLWHVEAEYHEALKPIRIEARDLDGDSSLEIFIDLESEWADARSVGFVILKREGKGNWNLIGLPSIAETTKEILDGAFPHPEGLRPPPSGPIGVFGMKKHGTQKQLPAISELKNASVYCDTWSFRNHGTTSNVTTLRNGGNYSVLQHTRKRHVQIAAIGFYDDGRSVLDAHYSVVTFFVLRNGQLLRDTDWNWGFPMLSDRPLKSSDINIEIISKAGIEAHKIGSNFFWYKSFEKE
jgi:hypothetical protein